MPSCSLGSPLSPPLSVKSCVLTGVCCWGWQTTARARGGREGGSATAARAAKRDKSSRGTPPLVRWTSLPHSRLLLLPSPSPFFPSSLPRCFSIIHQCADSPQLTAPAAAPADPSSPLGLLAYSSFFHAHPSILPDFHSQAWKLRAGPFLLLRERVSHHRAALLAAEKKRNPRGEKRGFFFFPPVFGCWRNPDHLPLICPHPPFLDYSSGFV